MFAQEGQTVLFWEWRVWWETIGGGCFLSLFPSPFYSSTLIVRICVVSLLLLQERKIKISRHGWRFLVNVLIGVMASTLSSSSSSSS